MSFMETCGLTAEYNPLHIGHQQQLAMIREQLGASVGIIVCMSGPFCQRGIPSLLDKGVRARLAIHMGADLVLELPQAFAISSAERFADGAVRSLLATGVVRHLAYGTEDPGHHQMIREAALLLTAEPQNLAKRIRDGIGQGLGFAAARQKALTDFTGQEDLGRLLRNSNTILAVEYEKALLRHGELPTLALPLIDKAETSASLIRDQIQSAKDSRNPQASWQIMKDLAPLLPPDSLAALMDAFTRGRGLVTEEDLALTLLLSPAFNDRGKLEKMEGMQAGLAGRLLHELQNDPAGALGREPNAYKNLIDRLASRTHPGSRVRRAILASALGIETANLALTQEGPAYIRVLAFNRRGRQLLSYMRKTARLPVIVNASQFRELDVGGRTQAALDLQAQTLWNVHAKLSQISEFDRRVQEFR